MASLTIRPAALADAADLGIIHYQSWLQNLYWTDRSKLSEPTFCSAQSAAIRGGRMQTAF